MTIASNDIRGTYFIFYCDAILENDFGLDFNRNFNGNCSNYNIDCVELTPITKICSINLEP